MASIIYKPLSALTPIELKYSYYKEEELQTSLQTFGDGRSFYTIKGLDNYQDVTINRESCFILTSAVNLSSIFTPTTEITIGELPASILLQPRSIGEAENTQYFIDYDNVDKLFTQTLTSGSVIFVKPVEGTNEVELKVNGSFLQVEPEYPYIIRLGTRSLDPESIYRQRFYPNYDSELNLISLRTKTIEGDRYLAVGDDTILRATGLILNNEVKNDYIFKCVPISDDTLKRGFASANNWVTYYFDIESSVDNKNLRINKNILPIQTNYLIDFPTESAAKTGKASINIANLKTAVTPAGGPAPIENAYNKEVITTN